MQRQDTEHGTMSARKENGHLGSVARLGPFTRHVHLGEPTERHVDRGRLRFGAGGKGLGDAPPAASQSGSSQRGRQDTGASDALPNPGRGLVFSAAAGRQARQAVVGPEAGQPERHPVSSEPFRGQRGQATGSGHLLQCPALPLCLAFVIVASEAAEDGSDTCAGEEPARHLMGSQPRRGQRQEGHRPKREHQGSFRSPVATGAGAQRARGGRRSGRHTSSPGSAAPVRVAGRDPRRHFQGLPLFLTEDQRRRGHGHGPALGGWRVHYDRASSAGGGQGFRGGLGEGGGGGGGGGGCFVLGGRGQSAVYLRVEGAGRDRSGSWDQ